VNDAAEAKAESAPKSETKPTVEQAAQAAGAADQAATAAAQVAKAADKAAEAADKAAAVAKKEGE
jgi:hypothetical protein